MWAKVPQLNLKHNLYYAGVAHIMRVWQKQCLSCKMLLLSLSIRINRLKPHFCVSLQSNGPGSLEICKQPLGNYYTENKFFDSKPQYSFLH